MTSCAAAILTESCYTAPLVPPGLPSRVLNRHLIDRAPSPDENQPPLGSTPNRKSENRRSSCNPLTDVTRLYSTCFAEAGHGDAPRSLERSIRNCRTSSPSPQSLVKADITPQPVAGCSDTNHSESISPVAPSRFDPFADDPAGPTQRLPSKFQGPLSVLWPRCRRFPARSTPVILYTSRGPPGANRPSSALLPFGSVYSLSRLILPEIAGVEQLESTYCLPAGLLDDGIVDDTLR